MRKIYFGSLVMSALCVVLACISCKRNDDNVEKFLDEQFPKYAEEAYLQQVLEEDVAYLTEFKNEYMSENASGRYKLYGGVYTSLDTANLENEFDAFVKFYEMVLYKCYFEEKHDESVEAQSREQMAETFFCKEDTNFVLNFTEIPVKAYALALSSVERVPEIEITEREAVNDSTWRVVTNGDKEFTVVFGNMDSENPTVEITADGKVFMAGYMKGNEEKSGRCFRLAFEEHILSHSLEETLGMLTELRFSAVEENPVDSFERAQFLSGSYCGYDDVRAEVLYYPADSVGDEAYVEGIVLSLGNDVDVMGIVAHIASDFGRYEKGVQMDDRSLDYCWRVINGFVGIEVTQEETKVMYLYPQYCVDEKTEAMYENFEKGL